MNRIIAICFAALSASVSFGAGQIVAQLNPGVNVTAFATQFGVSLTDSAPYYPFHLFTAPNGANVEAIENAMKQSGLVVFAEDNDECRSPESEGQFATDQGRGGGRIAAVYDTAAMNEVNPGLFVQIQYHFYPLLPGDRDIRVAILDTGVSPKSKRVWSHLIGGYNATGRPGPFPYDLPENVDTTGNGVFDQAVGHGTFVAGVIVGLAPNAKLVNVKVADSDGVATAWSIIKGICFARASRCELVNISLGSVDQIPAFENLAAWAQQGGMQIIAAAGNANNNRIMYPSREDNVIAVAGIDKFNRKASFSNYENKVKFSAPSVDIVSTYYNGGMASWSGTSFGTPIMTGIIADAIRRQPLRSPSALRSWLQGRGIGINHLNPNYVGKLGLKSSHLALWR